MPWYGMAELTLDGWLGLEFEKAQAMRCEPLGLMYLGDPLLLHEVQPWHRAVTCQWVLLDLVPCL